MSGFNFNPTPAIAHSNYSSNLVIPMSVDDIITRSSAKEMQLHLDDDPLPLEMPIAWSNSLVIISTTALNNMGDIGVLDELLCLAPPTH